MDMQKYIQKQNLKAELDYLKELFFEKLPVGQKMSEVKKYFSYLEDVIDNKDTDDIQREEFPPDDPTVGGDRVYKYHSSSQFKKLAGGYKSISDSEDMDPSKSEQEKLSAEPDKCAESKDVAHVSKHTEASSS